MTSIAAAITETINADPEKFYGDKELRWAQTAARNATIQHIEAGVRTILIVQPTGTGKTITMACTMDSPELRKALKVEDRNVRVLVIAHINHLLTQAERTFANANHVDLRVATPFTPISKETLDWCDIVVIDEAHHEAMMSIQLQLDGMVGLPIVGLTATKDRADGMVIKFEEIVEPVSRQQAVEEGWLAETSLWSFVDLSGKNKVPILCNIVRDYHEVMGQTLIFVKTKKESRELDDYITNELGLKSVALLNQTKGETTRLLDGFSNGEMQFIINCNKIGEGIDLTGCVSVIVGRQIGSYPQLNQIIGRTARPDSESQVFELINPLTGRNLDTTVVTGTPKRHLLISPVKKTGGWIERTFDYSAMAG